MMTVSHHIKRTVSYALHSAYCWDGHDYGVIVTIIKSGNGNPSSNPGWGWLHFT